MIVDMFGTEILVGHVIVISKGTRGHRDLETGIVTEIKETPSQAWIYTGYLGYSHKLSSKKHLAALTQKGNQHVLVVTDIASRPAIFQSLKTVAAALVQEKILPNDYYLGQGIPSTKTVKDLHEVENQEFEDLGIFLEAPQSLKK